jgi:dTDP-4-amino-4,6-dideoxygalactose transaminase
MVVSDSKRLSDRAEWYHDHGHDHNPKVSRAMEGRTILGFNYRMNELQGALGLAQLRKLDWLIGEQKQNKKAIKDWLAAVPGINFRELPDPEGDSATFLAFNLPDQSHSGGFSESPRRKRRRYDLLQEQSVALCAQLGTFPGLVHGKFPALSLQQSAVPGQDRLRPPSDPPGRRYPGTDAGDGNMCENAGGENGRDQGGD